MKILLTSVGRRTYLVKYFREALNGEGEVHVCNSVQTVAFSSADKAFVSPLIYDDYYIPFLIDYCKKNRIDILISLFDIDLLILSRNKKRFEEIGTKVLVSDEEIVSICNDKWKTYLFLSRKGFNVPITYIEYEKLLKDIDDKKVTYPIIVKPRFGCGSISINIAYNRKDLDYLVDRVNRGIEESYLKYESNATDSKIVFQQFLSGQEFGADIINDLNGKYQSSVIRKKIAMRSGETDIAEIVDNEQIKQELKRLGKETKHILNMDCDIFLVDGKPYILEMNARFGGGYPFSHIAGCNLPLAIIKWIKGEKVSKDLLSAQIGVCGYKDLQIVKM